MPRTQKTSQVELILSQVFGGLPEFSKTLKHLCTAFIKLQISLGLIGNIIFVIIVISSGGLSLPFLVNVQSLSGEQVQIAYNAIPAQYQFSLASINFLGLTKVLYALFYVIGAAISIKSVLTTKRQGWFFLVYSTLIYTCISLFNNEFLSVISGLVFLYALHQVKDVFTVS